MGPDNKLSGLFTNILSDINLKKSMARSDKLSHLFVKVSWNAPIDTLMRFFIIIVIEERIQSFKEFCSIVSRTNVNVITFNCSPKPFNKYIIRCTASTIHTNLLISTEKYTSSSVQKYTILIK